MIHLQRLSGLIILVVRLLLLGNAGFYQIVDGFILWKPHQHHSNPIVTPTTSLKLSSTSSSPQYNSKPSKNKRSSRRDQLHRVIQSIEFYGQDPGDKEQGASKELLEAMALLASARTQKGVTLAGRQLEELDIVEGESRAIQERVLKATALSGLFHTSVSILSKMLDESYLPSHMAYTPVCSALRRAGRNDQLEDVLYHLSEVASEVDDVINVVAWNTYLASICNSRTSVAMVAAKCRQSNLLRGTRSDILQYHHVYCRTSW
jgi:hypothetical protein